MSVGPETAEGTTVARDFWDRLPFDVRSAEFHAEPYPYFDRLRAEGPVVRLPDRVLVVTDYRECVAVLGDSRFGLGPSQMESQSFLLVDPPEHRRLRTRVAAPFTARAVERLRPAIGHRVAELLARADRSGEVEVIADLGVPLALDVICALVGVPLGERQKWFEALSWLAVGFDPGTLRDPGTSVRVACARVDFARYLGGLIEERRKNPAGDFVSALAGPGPDGSLLLVEQVITGVGQLVVAGYEPAVNLIGNGLNALLLHPQQLDHLRERPEAAPAAVEDLPRYDPRSS